MSDYSCTFIINMRKRNRLGYIVFVKADDRSYKLNRPVYSMVNIFQAAGQSTCLWRSQHRYLYRCSTVVDGKRPEHTGERLCISAKS